MVKQPEELRTYLEDMLKDPFNYFCINCKSNKSTHAVIWMGVFMCSNCAKELVRMQGGNMNCYVKEVYHEMWDDYQLRSLAFGGNK